MIKIGLQYWYSAYDAMIYTTAIASLNSIFFSLMNSLQRYPFNFLGISSIPVIE
jgi:hypothetical protein